MKSLLVLVLTLNSLSLFAAQAPECPNEFAEVTIKGLFNPKYSTEPKEEFFYQQSTKSKIFLTESQFYEIPSFTSYDYNACKDSIIFLSFNNIETGEYFYSYYTHSNKCDAGSSNGTIYNSEHTSIASIIAGDFVCNE